MTSFLIFRILVIRRLDGDGGNAKKYKVILIIIVLLFAFSCSILVNYRSYLQKKKDLVALVDVREGLSVNYGEGKYVVVNSLEREVSFSVTNLTS